MDRIKNDITWEERFLKLDLRYREHERLGAYAKMISAIRKKRDSLDSDFFIDMFDIDNNIYSKIIYLLNNNPECDSDDIAEKLLNEEY